MARTLRNPIHQERCFASSKVQMDLESGMLFDAEQGLNPLLSCQQPEPAELSTKLVPTQNQHAFVLVSE